jgi:hypothetical protein
MRKLVYVSSTILFSLLISGCGGGGDNDNPQSQPIDNENYAGIWAGGFGSDIVGTGGFGVFIIGNNSETYFTSGEEDRIAFKATYEEKLASEIYDAQEIVDYLAEGRIRICEEYEVAGYIIDCSEITAANLDTIVGPIFEGTDITWYQGSIVLEGDPVFGSLERVSAGLEFPIHLAFPVIDDDDIALYIGEIDQVLLTPSTSLEEAMIGEGGGEFILPSSDVPVLLSALAGEWQANFKPAGITIEENGEFEGGDDSLCLYAGQITEREKDAYIFDATLTVDCDGSVFDGAYTGILAANLDEGSILLVVTTGDGEYMISQGFDIDGSFPDIT